MLPYLEGSDVQRTFSIELLTPAGVETIQSKTMENNPRRTKTSTAPLQQSTNLRSATFTDNPPPQFSITQFYTASFLVLSSLPCCFLHPWTCLYTTHPSPQRYPPSLASQFSLSLTPSFPKCLTTTPAISSQ